MTEYENPMDDYWPNSEGREKPQLTFHAVDAADVVRVALRFVAWFDPSMSEDEIIGHIMRALGGKANPRTLREEIIKLSKKEVDT